MKIIYLLEKREYVCDDNGECGASNNEIIAVCSSLRRIKTALFSFLENNKDSGLPTIYWVHRAMVDAFDNNIQSRIILEGDLNSDSKLFED